MRTLVFLLLMTGQAAAQTALERIEPRLNTAIAEHRVFLTCSSLDPQLHASVQNGWKQMVARARHFLESHYTSLTDLARFDDRTAEEHLVPTEAPLRDAIALCTTAHRDWQSDYNMFNFTIDITGAAEAK